ncbi:hypothetical protein KVP09_16060 [Alcaligenaceae bacterium CGII-47]|nr:hypothetical protein [Alcaligenaceae bacterium CGII-47]
MESPARRAFLTGHRAEQTPWQALMQRLRRGIVGKLFDFDTPTGSARLVPGEMADVYRARALCQELGVRLALDAVPHSSRLDDGPVLWVEPGLAMSRFQRLSPDDTRWFVQPGCLIGDLEQAGLRQFVDLPCHLTVAAWLADRECCDWRTGRTADSGLVHALLLLNDGTQANLGAFGEANHKPLDTSRMQQMIPELFELNATAPAAQLHKNALWPGRYRLDALAPEDGGEINLAHLLLGHGGDLGWVEWVVLDERAPQYVPHAYQDRFFQRVPSAQAQELDQQIKAVFDPTGVFPDAGQGA